MINPGTDADRPGAVHPDPVNIADIERARTLLADVARTTPLEGARWLSDLIGGPAYLKCENLQRAGSFKIRGAYVRIARLSAAERERGVVAASAGNHAQGVALAASLLDTHATVFMPSGAPLPKERATRAYGADVRFVGQTIDEALVAATRFAEKTGAVLIHPFDHGDIVAGQGTVGLELLEQCPEVATVVCSVGGGGLIAGLATAMKARRRQRRRPHPADRPALPAPRRRRPAAGIRRLDHGHPDPASRAWRAWACDAFAQRDARRPSRPLSAPSVAPRQQL